MNLPSPTPLWQFARVSTVQPTPAPLLPRNSPSSICSPNEVIVELTTTLLIPDYSRFYDSPITQFQPSFHFLDDGSLITDPFLRDMSMSDMSLFVNGTLTMLFLRNLFVSGDYIRRARVKRKDLFYVLFASQLLAFASIIPTIVSQFSSVPNCDLAFWISSIAATISLAMLITWILGYKAYKCLNNSRFVLVSLFLFLCSAISIAVLDLITTQSVRRLTAGCMRISSRFLRVYVLIHLGETLFLSGCFLYAVWKSRGSPVARQRLSVRISLDDSTPLQPNEVETETTNGRRGWWDYVPKRDPLTSPSAARPQTKEIANSYSWLARLFGAIHKDYRQILRLRKESGMIQIPDEPQAMPKPEHPVSKDGEPRQRFSVASSFGRISRYMPVQVFRTVMRDELCYTAVIAASYVVVAVFTLIGLNTKNSLPVFGWLTLNWAITSLLAVHTFGRVIRRQERDAILQAPLTWHTVGQPISSHSPPSSRPRRQWPPPISTSSTGRARSASAADHDPFSDTRALNASRNSGHSGLSASWYSTDLPSPVRSVIKESMPANMNMGLDELPSLLIDEFPTSGRTTPLVPHDSLVGGTVIRQSRLESSRTTSQLSSFRSRNVSFSNERPP